MWHLAYMPALVILHLFKREQMLKMFKTLVKKTGPINSTLFFTIFTKDPTQECKSVNKLQRVVFPDNPVLLTRLSWALLVYVLEYF